MKDSHMMQKEELLTKLTDIYDQLEDLERSIDENLAKHRNEIIHNQSRQLNDCEKRLQGLEDTYFLSMKTLEKSSSNKSGLQRNMKLKLGY